MLGLSSPLKLRTRITLLVCTVIALVLLVVHAIFVTQSTALSKNSLEKSRGVAHTLTETPFVGAAITYSGTAASLAGLYRIGTQAE